MDTAVGVAAGGGDEQIAASGPFQEHLPCSFAYKVVSSLVPDFPRSSTWERIYANCKRKQSSCFMEYIATPQQLLELTEAELRYFHTADNCHICNQPRGGDKERDHCHIVGKYRGAEHSSCNLAYRISKYEWKLPLVMHNLKGYDGHLIVKALKSEFGEVRVIPQNMENYLSITVDKLKFIDSLQFTPQSLDSLVKTLEVDEFKHIREEFPI